ncbi:MAG: FHA domain-containing protein [Candidatus Adiutrix sp.]|jgi:pSer/pThr/pTyr-binding forkhead associated (FHA) protein/S1-C subfamily serine protease|nr:FHA domain-containing protein [Candidatus Adiutrix sp.]
MKCPRCQKESGAGAPFCGHCGASFASGGQAGPIIIGRGREADFRLTSRKASKRQASLSPRGDGRFLLQDLGSSNGVFVGSPTNRVQSAVVGLDDLVYFADQAARVSDIVKGRPPAPEAAASLSWNIGRTADNEIVINDDSISRRHALLEALPGGGWRLTDAGSHNGTQVNARKIGRAAISAADQIKFGRYEIRAAELMAKASAVKAGGRSSTGWSAAGWWPQALLGWPAAAKYMILFVLAMAVFGLSQISLSLQIGPQTAPPKAAKPAPAAPPPTAPKPAPPAPAPVAPAPVAPPPAAPVPAPVAPPPAAPVPAPVAPPPAAPVPAPVAPAPVVPPPAPPAPAPPTAPPPAESEQKYLELAERATVYVQIKATTGSGFYSGSGFFIAPDLIMTNRHVVEGGKGPCLVINKALGRPLEARVAARGAGDRDYAVLRVAPQAGITPLSLSAKAKRADRVAAWGFPGLLAALDPNSIPEVVYSSGEISVVYENLRPPLIAHTAVISPGNSGGPLIDARGRVAGINTLLYRNPGESFREAYTALAARDIIAFLREKGLAHTTAD